MTASVRHSFVRQLSRLLTSLYSEKRNLYDVFGYKTNPSYNEKYIKYLRQDIAGRVIDAPAAALWTNPPEVTSNNPEWQKSWDNIVSRHNLWNVLEKADKLAGIGRYSVVLIGFNDGSALDKPVNTRSLKQQKNPILYLQPYSEQTVRIKTFDSNNQSETFMQPLMYEVSPNPDEIHTTQFNLIDKKEKTKMLGSFDVHASRILHIAENTLENDVYGSPRIERVFNVFDDLLKVTGGSSETFWLTANRGLHVNIDKDMEMDSTDEQNLSAEIDEYQHYLRRVIRTRGAKISNIGSDTPDPSGVFNMLIAVISGATGIPKRILTGSEAGQLASEQDRANWAERIEERRNSWATPIVIYPLIKKLANAKVLNTLPDTKITIVWGSAFKLSPLEFAQASAQHARSATNFAKAIESMEKLKRGEPAQAPMLDEEGNEIPGTGKEAVEGSELEELVTIEEARKFMGLEKPKLTYDDKGDIDSE